MYYWEPEYHILFLTDDSKRQIASSPLICPHPHPQSTHEPHPITALFIWHATPCPNGAIGPARGQGCPAWARLWFHRLLLLLELSELRLDGDGCLLRLGGTHVDVNVLSWDVLLRRVCGNDTLCIGSILCTAFLLQFCSQAWLYFFHGCSGLTFT